MMRYGKSQVLRFSDIVSWLTLFINPQIRKTLSILMLFAYENFSKKHYADCKISFIVQFLIDFHW
jgi:hypothetical protein